MLSCLFRFPIRYRIIIVTRIVLLLVLSGCSKTPELTRVPPHGTILAFGDSLTYGTGVKANQSYPAVLEELSGRRVVRSGVPGETTAEGVLRLPAVLDEVQPLLVILELGGNDILHRGNKQAAKDNLAKMVQLIRDNDIEVMLVGVPEFGIIPGTAEFYLELEEELMLAAENDIVAALERDAAMKSDSVHFNAQGYRKMAEAIYQRLLELGAL